MLNDQIMHKRVLAGVVPNYAPPVRIPKSHDIIEADDARWNDNLERFETSPAQVLQACRAYKQERIPAIPQPIRELLINKYCRESLQAATRTSKRNEDCLIRLYTGKRRTPGRSSMFFNLCNYSLCVDQIEELGLQTNIMAMVLGEALAHCY